MVTLIESTHTYVNEKQQVYKSVGKLIKEYTPPFQSDYWSKYKAIKDVLVQHDVWEKYKAGCGGWENVVEHYERNPVFIDKILSRQKEYLQEWKVKAKEATEYGSEVHLSHEQEDLEAIEIYFNDIPHKIVKEDIVAIPDFESNLIVLEQPVYSHILRLAGTPDRLVKTGKDIVVVDYKTNKSISTRGFRGETLLGPLSELENCSFSIYTMQLSLYAWLLERRGYNITKMYIVHEPSTGLEPKQLDVPYRKDLVLGLIKYHYDGKI